MSKLLWQPVDERGKSANITKFIGFVNERHGNKLDSYDELYDWSVNNIPDFWAAVWDFVDIKTSRKYETIVDDFNKMPGAK